MKKENNKESEVKESSQGKIAVILIRSIVGSNYEVKDALRMLRLKKKNICVVLEKNPSNLGMVKKVKDLVTWGELNEEVLGLLKDKKTINLHPPRGGFERKGIKIPFKVGGALGYRGEKINDLIKRMLP
ncbi:uL30 family ribosomal protein [Nanoarchaeota archaeon]